MKTVFLICGRSASGKDKIVSTACRRYGYKQLKSYATRPMRLDDEDKDHHIFVTPEEAQKIKQQDEICAYTEIGPYEYCATLSQLKQCDLYIIDYNGVKYLNDKLNTLQNSIRIVTIYILCDDDVRMHRAVDNRRDDELAFYKRSYDENTQFNQLERELDFDYAISNDNLERAVYVLHHIMAAEKINDWST